MSSPVPNSPKVFISYSWDSPKHKDRVLALADRLRSDGIDCTLDQYEVSPPEGWPRWMERQIREADFVLMICTETYLRRVLGEESPGKGHGVRWEGHLTYQDLYNAGTLNTKFIPVLLESGKFEHIPTPLQGSTFYKAHTEEGYEALYRHLTNQPYTLKPELGKLQPLPHRERKQDFSQGTQDDEPKPEEKEQNKGFAISPGLNQRLKALEENITMDIELLQQFENDLRYTTDPRKKIGYRQEIEKIKESLKHHQQEYAELKQQLGG